MTSTNRGPLATESERAQADNAVTHAHLIADGDALDQASESWLGAPALGIDTEFVRERTFFPRPGLVQVSEGQNVWLLDATLLPDMPSLAATLENTAQTKVLHSVGEDLEIFDLLTGTLPDPLFDTQIAAALLGYPLQCRYEQLVTETLGVDLAGGKARSNWCKRPLARDLLVYAAQDVVWLPRLHAHLAERLEQTGRLAWLEEDCARLVQKARDGNGRRPLMRVKGAGRLPDAALARLDRLAEWREEIARRRDLPRSFVIRDDDLLRLAECNNKSGLQSALQSLPHPVQRRHGDDLKALLSASADTDFQRPAELIPLDNEQRDWIRQAQQSVGELARELGLEAAMIASKRELTRLARGERPSWLQGWRGPLLQGRLQW